MKKFHSAFLLGLFIACASSTVLADTCLQTGSFTNTLHQGNFMHDRTNIKPNADYYYDDCKLDRPIAEAMQTAEISYNQGQYSVKLGYQDNHYVSDHLVWLEKDGTYYADVEIGHTEKMRLTEPYTLSCARYICTKTV